MMTIKAVGIQFEIAGGREAREHYAFNVLFSAVAPRRNGPIVKQAYVAIRVLLENVHVLCEGTADGLADVEKQFEMVEQLFAQASSEPFFHRSHFVGGFHLRRRRWW